jgi:hypothetical protein
MSDIAVKVLPCDGGLITHEHLALPATVVVPLAQSAAAAVNDTATVAPPPSDGADGLDVATMERTRIELALSLPKSLSGRSQAAECHDVARAHTQGSHSGSAATTASPRRRRTIVREDRRHSFSWCQRRAVAETWRVTEDRRKWTRVTNSYAATRS